MGLITQLQAINQMLLTSGENLVADLDNNSGIDTGIAETILDQSSLDFQLRGMANNKIVRKLNPSVLGFLLLPTADDDEQGLISAELISTHHNTNNERIITRVITSSPTRLWNIVDDTDVFTTGDYYVEIISKLPWENLDTPVQRAIMATAVRHYQALTQGDEVADAFLNQQEAIFNAKGKAADINDKRRNLLNGGESSVRRAVSRYPYMFDPSFRRFFQG